MEEFLKDSDLADLFAELEAMDDGEELNDREMDASTKRYNEIIKKHKND